MSVPAVLIRKSTGDVIKHGTLPANPEEPIPGLDPDLEWLIKHEPYPAPDYDPRVYVLETTQDATATPHLQYGNYNQWRITYGTNRRPAEDIVTAVEERERIEVDRQVPYTEQMKLLLLGLGVLFRKIDGLQLNTQEQAIANRVMSAAVKLWKNDARRRQLATQIAANEPIDIDAGWEP